MLAATAFSFCDPFIQPPPTDLPTTPKSSWPSHSPWRSPPSSGAGWPATCPVFLCLSCARGSPALCGCGCVLLLLRVHTPCPQHVHVISVCICPAAQPLLSLVEKHSRARIPGRQLPRFPWLQASNMPHPSPCSACSLLEERTRALGRQLSRLPVAMAQTGDIPVSEKQILKVSAGTCPWCSKPPTPACA